MFPLSFCPLNDGEIKDHKHLFYPYIAYFLLHTHRVLIYLDFLMLAAQLTFKHHKNPLAFQALFCLLKCMARGKIKINYICGFPGYYMEYLTLTLYYAHCIWISSSFYTSLAGFHTHRIQPCTSLISAFKFCGGISLTSILKSTCSLPAKQVLGNQSGVNELPPDRNVSFLLKKKFVIFLIINGCLNSLISIKHQTYNTRQHVL